MMTTIQTLEANEIDMVDGGVLPAVIVWAIIEGAGYGFATYLAIKEIAS